MISVKERIEQEVNQSAGDIVDAVKYAFDHIAPSWPLKNIIAVNPLKGFEALRFAEAVSKGMYYFQKQNCNQFIKDINIETIKWCQIYFDEGQATIKMPLKNVGLYRSYAKLARYDRILAKGAKDKISFLKNMPNEPMACIGTCLEKMGIRKEEYAQFCLWMLTLLPGWASYIKYLADWSHAEKLQSKNIEIDYLALRISLAYLLCPSKADILHLYTQHKWENKFKNITGLLDKIKESESLYQRELIANLAANSASKQVKPVKSDAQFVFCIDVRSEPMRRAVESSGNYETFGFAGFFGVPVQVDNTTCNASYASCPVLLTPKHQVSERVADEYVDQYHGRYERTQRIKQTYQMLKYMFTTPFSLVEIMGLCSGIWMLMRSVLPKKSNSLKKFLFHSAIEDFPVVTDLNESSVNGLRLQEQCQYAESFLRMIGMLNDFSEIIILCGHGAETENNAYQSALDCGACGGHQGAPNARVLAKIMNSVNVREVLAQRGIVIPDNTVFIAALHNTTNDHIELMAHDAAVNPERLIQIQKNLNHAQALNQQERGKKLQIKAKSMSHAIERRSKDWAETRPEWGLAGNAAFIVGPRAATKAVNLNGRVFLHSYDWRIDHDGQLLETILTAPMIVAQWINAQYLFSTLDNIAFGSGSKITHNITGKIGIIQGNGSDLMHGLPLQSVYATNVQPYHEPLRLLTIVHAPLTMIDRIIAKTKILTMLFSNEWVHLNCVNPEDNCMYALDTNLKWNKVSN